MIRFLMNNGRSQLFSQEEHGEFFKDMAERFHRMHQHQISSREHLTKQVMQLTSMSNQSATLVTADGRTITVTEGLPVSVMPQDIQTTPTVPAEGIPEVAPVEAAPVDEAPAEVAPEAPVEAPAVETPADPIVPAPAE